MYYSFKYDRLNALKIFIIFNSWIDYFNDLYYYTETYKNITKIIWSQRLTWTHYVKYFSISRLAKETDGGDTH